MAKVKESKAVDKASKAQQTTSTNKATLLDLKEDKEVWYKIHILIYDLCNLKTDKSSETRIGNTVDELYISTPYFTDSQAAFIKAALVADVDLSEEAEDVEGTSTENISRITGGMKTVEEAIKGRLSNFYDKRKASGDFRPCGPHDMAPVYLDVFGIPRSEIEDERFLGRLRRSGLDNSQEKSSTSGNTVLKDKGKKRR